MNIEIMDSDNGRSLEVSVNNFLCSKDEQLSWERLREIENRLRNSETNVRSQENFSIMWRNVLVRMTDLLKMNCFSERWKRDTFENIFFKGLSSSSLIILSSVFQQTKFSYKQDVLLDMLEYFMKSDCIIMMLVDQSNVVPEHQKHLWNDLITIIVSLPERVANGLEGQSRPFFKLENYFSHLASILMEVLILIHQRLETGLDSSVEFLSQLLGRLAILGNAGRIFQNLTPALLGLMKKNFLWKKMVQRLLDGIPDRCLELLTINLLCHIQWHGYVEHFLGDSVLKRSVLKFLLTKKFILVHYFDIKIAQNCLGYMATSDIRKDIFFQTVGNVLEVWGDKSALLHQPQQQHFYLSSVIMIAAGHMRKMEVPENLKSEFNRKLLHGIQNHISHSMQEVREQGMIVGQFLVEVLDHSGPKLNFEYDMSPDLEKLTCLKNIPGEPQWDAKEGNEELIRNLEQMNISVDCQKIASPLLSEAVKDADGTLDSDDELEAYDLSSDVCNEQTKRPCYIRDCLEGLLNNNDADFTQACLESVTELVVVQKHAIHEIAIDLMRVLLNLEDTYGITDFVLLRFKALVAVCVHCPKETAEFLTKEFYDSNYNIRQRIDILEVIIATSQEMSSLKKVSPVSKTPDTVMHLTISEKSWSEIVQQRIDEKTRRFAKVRREEVVSVENRFGKVAGFFFFPLMQHFDRKANTFDLLGEDHYVLGRLVYTLGMILNCAANCPIFKNMSHRMLEFIWVLRYHTERFVRRSLLFAAAMVILNQPPQLLFADFQTEFLECQQWLKDVLQQDPDDECRKRSAQLLECIARITADFYSKRE